MIKYPYTLKNGDKLGITAMSCGCVEEEDFLKFDNAKNKLKTYGIDVFKTENTHKCIKFVSSSAEKRVEEFMSLWKNDNVKAIVIASGGEFLMETLPYLEKHKEDFENVSPKWIQGYSDVSLLNFYLTTNFNFATIHSYNFFKFGADVWHESVSQPLNVMMNGEMFTQDSFEMYEAERDENRVWNSSFNFTNKVEYKNLYENKDLVTMNGRVIGGCIDVLKVILGTRFDNTVNFCRQFKEGMLWYIDDCEMPITELKRTLWQMKMAGWFSNANGFIIGRTRAREDIFDFNYLDAFHDVFDDMNLPVIYDVDVGHVSPQWTLVNGAYAEFRYENGKAKITQELI